MCVYLVNLTVWVNGIECVFYDRKCALNAFFYLAADAKEAMIIA